MYKLASCKVKIEPRGSPVPGPKGKVRKVRSTTDDDDKPAPTHPLFFRGVGILHYSTTLLHYFSVL